MRTVASSQLPVASRCWLLVTRAASLIGTVTHKQPATSNQQRPLATGNWQLATALTLIVLFLAQPLFACPVCYGSPDDPMVKATNKGIWVLLGFVGFVQIGFGALFFAFWRRARQQKRFRDSFHIVEGGPLS